MPNINILLDTFDFMCHVIATSISNTTASTIDSMIYGFRFIYNDCMVDASCVLPGFYSSHFPPFLYTTSCHIVRVVLLSDGTILLAKGI